MSLLLEDVRGERSQAEAGRAAEPHLGRALSQSKVSRAESGHFPLSPEEADAFARGCGATAEQRRQLVQLARDFAASHVTTRAALQRSGRAIQERVARLERDSTLIRSWQDAIVVGVAQTDAYTAAVAGDPDDAGWWEARRARRERLAEAGREWRLLMYEGALRWALRSPAVMAEQMAHLIEVSRMPTVRLGIVDQATVKASPPPPAFHLYGRRTAEAATASGTAFLTDPGDVAHYEALFGELEQAARYGDEARDLLAALAEHYRAG